MATARFGLARALPAGEHARALALARQARAQYATLAVQYRLELGAVDAWLAAQR
jgi:hypothetical protein